MSPVPDGHPAFPPSPVPTLLLALRLAPFLLAVLRVSHLAPALALASALISGLALACVGARAWVTGVAVDTTRGRRRCGAT